MARKTIDVQALVAIHERMTLGSMQNPKHIANPEEGKRFRESINFMIETALHDTGNYRGFRNLVDHTIDDSARFYYSA